MCKDLEPLKFIIDAVSPSFWEIMTKADSDSRNLSLALSRLSDREICMFQYEYETAVNVLIPDIMDILSTDWGEAKELASWIVSQGKAYYIEVLDDPRVLVNLKETEYDGDLIHIAFRVYWSKFEDIMPIPSGGYWHFELDPWIGKAEYQSREGDSFEDVSTHNEFVRRLKKDSGLNE